MSTVHRRRSRCLEHPLLWFVLPLAALLTLSGLAEAASNSSTVIKYLPGYSGELPFYLETGYIGIEDDTLQHFYYFVKSQTNASADPLVFWINGGPGCSGLYGFMFESGPLSFVYRDFNWTLPSLRLNPYTWTKSVNMVYIDAPVGTGFSYSTTAEGYYVGDELFAEQIFQIIKKWLDEHPDFSSNEHYIGGDSYSGTPIPIFVEGVVEGKWNGTSTLNLKGYILGNPVTDSFVDDNSRIPFAHRLALISDKIYAAANKSCNGDFVNVDSTNVDCVADIDTIDELVQQILLVNILEPYCQNALSMSGSLDSASARRSLAQKLGSSIRSRAKGPALWCRNYNHVFCVDWVNHKEVRAALNVRDGTKSAWVFCNSTLAYTEEFSSVLPFHKNLSKTDLRALVYSGDHDMSIPHMGTQRWIDSLNMTLVEPWRPWHVNNQTAGYTKKYTNDAFSLTFATVKGAGHFATEYKVRECSAMMRRWLAYDDV